MKVFKNPICTRLSCVKHKQCLLKHSVKDCIHYIKKEKNYECKINKNKKSIWTF